MPQQTPNPARMKDFETRKTAILQAIQDYTAQHSHAPTVRDLANAAHLSTSVVHTYIKVLAAQGLLIYNPHKARSLALVPPDVAGGTQDLVQPGAAAPTQDTAPTPVEHAIRDTE